MKSIFINISMLYESILETIIISFAEFKRVKDH